MPILTAQLRLVYVQVDNRPAIGGIVSLDQIGENRQEKTTPNNGIVDFTVIANKECIATFTRANYSVETTATLSQDEQKTIFVRNIPPIEKNIFFHAINRQYPINQIKIIIDRSQTRMKNLKETILYTDANGDASTTLAKGLHNYQAEYDNWQTPVVQVNVEDNPVILPIDVPDMPARIIVKDDNGTPLTDAQVLVNDITVGSTGTDGKFIYYASKILDDSRNLIQYNFKATYNGITSAVVTKAIRCPEGSEVNLIVSLKSTLTFHASNKKTNANVAGMKITLLN